MISSENTRALQAEKINYILGARLSNLSADLLAKIDAGLPKTDGSMMRLPTDKGNLICSFSQKRYRKDRHEMHR